MIKKATVRATGIVKWEAAHMEAKVLKMHSMGTLGGMDSLVINSSLRKLSAKLITCVIKKLAKYPATPYRGSNTYKSATSMTEVKMLYRTQTFCCPIPFIMASVMASQYSMGISRENQRR